jgi:S-adenosylmethionine:tRNA ribosyltransferase-isomerase
LRALDRWPGDSPTDTMPLFASALMRIEALDYDLPPERIATDPAEPRDAARLMVVDRATEAVGHHQVRDLPDLGLLQSGDLLVLNRTQVLPASFAGRREATGGQVSGLYLAEPAAGRWLVMLEARGKLTAGERIALMPAGAGAEPEAEASPAGSLELIEAHGGGQWSAALSSDAPTAELLGRIGATPLPPYIKKARRLRQRAEVEPGDADRYNTVFARAAGSLAAPTAGLHFTPELLDRLQAQGVGLAELTLHVGVGTFTPIREGGVSEHSMHREWVDVPGETIAALQATRQAGRRIVAVGTTAVRAMESLPEPLTQCADGYTGETELFIHPEADFEFRFTDALLTNFHLPRSTLLAMVATLPGVGLDRLKQWYALAIEQHYRFYSYGDAMLLW